MDWRTERPSEAELGKANGNVSGSARSSQPTSDEMDMEGVEEAVVL